MTQHHPAAIPDDLSAAGIQGHLHAGPFGRSLTVAASTDSTNRQLAHMAEAGAPEGAVLVAETQTAGRGRMERTWFSPPGLNLYFSLLLRPSVDPALATTLPLLCGVVMARAVEQAAPELRAQIKWPNDLWLDSKKVCGVLCEMGAEAGGLRHVVVGIGLNVNLPRARLPKLLASTATSLRMAAGRTFDRAALMADILNLFDAAYQQWLKEGLAPFLPEIAARDVLRGKQIAIEQHGGVLAGTADGVMPDGSLRLVLPDGTVQNILAGDAHIRSV
jgi:BirA family biotin operon repressor/biotin-[acetyl-CoA-carboxylase] ligase